MDNDWRTLEAAIREAEGRAPFDPAVDHPFDPGVERARLDRQALRDEGVTLVNVHASGDGGGGFWRKGFRAEQRRGLWANLVRTPRAIDGSVAGSYMLIAGWRPFFSVTVEVKRRGGG